MEHTLTDAGLRMTYLRHPYQLDELDQDAILEDVSGGRVERLASAYLTNINFNEYDHLVLATDCRTERTVGMLGLHEGNTGQEDFLHLRTAFIAPAARGRGIMDRMTTHALLRVASFAPVPQVIAARTSNPNWFRSLRKLSQRFAGAVFFPDHNHPAIRLDSVKLARRLARQLAPNLHFDIGTATLRGGRIAAGLSHGSAKTHPPSKDPRIDALFGQHLEPADQMLLTIDLRAQNENAILDTARRIYRTRESTRVKIALAIGALVDLFVSATSLMA